jgi:hypothetical protein
MEVVETQGGDTMWAWVIGLFLLGHAFVHAVWRTYGPKTSWLLANASPSTLTSLSTALFVVSAIGFALAGLGLILHLGWWKSIALISAAFSLSLLLIFWGRGLIVGTAIDLAILVSVLWLHWPPQVFRIP